MSRIRRRAEDWLKCIIYVVYLFYCRCRFGPDIRLIPLSRLKFALVEGKDYERLNKFHWRARRFDKIWYAVRWVRKCEKSNKTVAWMHRAVMRAPRGKLIDHRNHNGLDNRRENLRIATYSQNMQNRRKVGHRCSSKYKGVMRRKNKQMVRRWRASIKVKGRLIELGMYMTEKEAARAYDRAASKYFGEFAWLNFPKRCLPRRSF